MQVKISLSNKWHIDSAGILEKNPSISSYTILPYFGLNFSVQVK